MTDDKNLQFNSEQLRDLLSPYLDNEVTAEERRLVEQGLATSVELRQELESLRQTVALIAALPPVPAPRPFTLTEAQVRPAAPTARKGLFGLPLWVQGWAALAASLVCVLVVGGILWSTQMGRGGAGMPAAEVANAPQMTAPAPERDTAIAVIPTESPAQKPAAAAPAEGGVEESAAAREAVTETTDELQSEAAAAVPPATSSAQESTAAQADALRQEVQSPEVTATPEEMTTLAESQPAPPPAADQETATQSLAAGAAPAPAPTLAPIATTSNAAPAMKESAETTEQSSVAEAVPPAEIPPTAEVQGYAAAAQESAPIAPATETAQVQTQALPPTATSVPPTPTPTTLPSTTPVAMLTLPAPTPDPTAASLPSDNAASNRWPLIAGVLVLIVIAVVIWLYLRRSPR